MSEDGDRPNEHGGEGSMVLGRYRLDEQVGAGGMGVLWRATDTLLEGVVALKRVPLALLGSGPVPNTRERTLREARMAAKLRGHRHVVSIFDAQVADDDVWLVLEYVPSRSLAQVLTEEDTLAPGEVARIGSSVADALDAAHKLGIQHRDVTPANVLIGSDETVKLTDFGLAQSIGDARLTQTGAVTGTVAYLAPEVAREGESETASDVFSLGATLYAALEGQPPFGRNANAVKLLHIVSTGIIRPPERAAELEPLLLRMLAPVPADRPDAATVRDWLAHVATQRPGPPPELPAGDSARPPLPAGGGYDGPTELTPAAAPGRHTGAGRRRSRGGWLAAAGVVLVGALVGTILLLGNAENAGQADARSTGTVYRGDPAWPELTGLPETVGRIDMGNEVETVDPCGLIPAAELRPFGEVEVRRGIPLYGCEALISQRNGGRSQIGFELSEPRPDALDYSAPDKRTYDLGGVKVYQGRAQRVGSGSKCSGEIIFSDNSALYTLAFPVTAPKLTPNPCELVAALNTAIVNQVARTAAIPHNGWAGGFPLTKRDACTLVDERTLARVPGLRYAAQVPGFAHSACKWGEEPDDTTLPAVFVGFFLESEEQFTASNAHQPITVGGSRAYQTVVDSEPVPNNCTITLPQQGKPTGAQRYEVVRVRAQVPAQRPQQCASARLVASAVERSLR